jgi:non-specific serine/threonine protein kinase/serine/threonine-protein kinase
MHEMVRAVCEQEPEKPSTAIGRVTEGPGQGTITPALVGSMRSARPEKLRSRLAGDLDNILLKALRKEPDRRYASVEQFSEDIRRYLGGLPVIARNDTLAYRTGKFVRRHKTGLAAAVLVMFGLIAGIIVTLREARIAREQAAIARAQRAKAEQRFSDVRKLANSLMFEMHDAIQDLPGATHARELLVKRASEYLDELAAEASGDASLQNELATAYEKVGDIQASTGSESVGNTRGAEESYRKAVKIREALTRLDRSPKARTGLALVSSKLASVLESKGDFTEAVQIDRRAVAIAEELYPADPKGNANRLAVLTVRLGYHLYMKGDWTESEKTYERGIQVLEIAKASHAGGKITEYNLGFAYMKAGKLALRQARWERALEDYRKSMAASQAWLASPQKNVRAQLNLAYGYLGIGDSLSGKQDFRGALANYRKAETIANTVAKADPNDARAAASLGDIYGGLAGALDGQGNLQAALRYHQAAVSIFEKQHAADPLQADIQRGVGDSSADLGDAYRRLATKPGIPKNQRLTYWRDAQSSYRRSLEAYADLSARGALASPVADQPNRVARRLSACARALTRLGAVSAPVVSK